MYYTWEFFRDKAPKILNYKFRNGKTFKTLIRYVINDLFEYDPKVNGVVNTGLKGDLKRSLLNFLNTNYSGLRLLVNWINKQIDEGNIKGYTKIDLTDDEKLGNELYKFYTILKKYGDYIFSERSGIMGSLLSVMMKTYLKGKKAESKVVEYLTKMQECKNIYNINLPVDGDTSDMYDGVDVTFEYKNKTYKIQVKTARKHRLEDGYYIFENISNMKQYDTNKIDYLFFYETDYDKVRGFRYDNDVIVDEDKLSVKIPYKNKVKNCNEL
jgi:hypothetical protein